MAKTPYSLSDIEKMDIVKFLDIVDEVSNKLQKDGN